MGKNKWRFSKKIYIRNRVRLSFRVKKIILNQILFSKLWYTGQIYTVPKYIKNEIQEYTISSATGRNTTFQTPSSTLHWERRTRYFRHKHTIKLYKNNMVLKTIKSHQCSLERSHAVLFEINSELWSRPSPF